MILIGQFPQEMRHSASPTFLGKRHKLPLDRIAEFSESSLRQAKLKAAYPEIKAGLNLDSSTKHVLQNDC
jgi:hypothetical protein